MLIKNAICFIGGEEGIFDVRIEDQTIDKISKNIRAISNERVIDLKSSSYLLPGAIDLNVRIKDDILSDKNLLDIVNDASSGGVSSFVLMPSFSPTIKNGSIMGLLKRRFENIKSVNIFISTLAMLQDNKILNDIATLTNYGSKAIYSHSDIKANTLRRIFEYSNFKNIPIFCYCENFDISNNGVMSDGELSFNLGLPAISSVSQDIEVAKAIQMCSFFKAKVHFKTIFSPKSIEMIDSIQDEYKDIYTEVAIHNLIFDEDMCKEYNTYAKTRPPLVNKETKEKLLEALKLGKIKTITSAHSPKSVAYKDVAFEDAKFGIDTLKDFFPLCYTYLVKNKIISFNSLTEFLSKNPARVLGLENKGELKEGYDADLITFDSSYKYIPQDKTLLYSNKPLYGKVGRIF